MAIAETLITENLDTWTSAIKKKSSAGRGGGKKQELYGIKKLRELILELAVRGLLVEQDPEDEPASDLLKRIAKEKAKSLRDGTKKERKPLPAIKSDQLPYKIPTGWSWVRFGEISLIERGGSPRPIKSYLTESDDGLNWIKIGDTDQGGKYIRSTAEKIRAEGLHKTRMVYPGDFLLTNSMSFGRPYITLIEGCIHDGWLRISPPESLDKDFLYILLSSPFVHREFKASASGAVVQNLNSEKVRGLLISLPPLAEQHRIVAKVDELMALCDRLELGQEDHLRTHDTLVKTLLGALTTAADPDRFSNAWKMIESNFDTLFTTESSIDELKQTILQLAVMGKLVPQDPNDEPASELLKNIEAERKRLIREKKISKQKSILTVSGNELPFELPVSWEWCRFGLLFKSFSNGLYKKASFYSENGIISLRMYNINDGAIDFAGSRRVVVNEEELQRYSLEAGDLLINRVNSKELVGKTALIPPFEEPLVFESMNMRAKPFENHLDSAYLNLFMRARIAKETIFSFAKEAVGQASINQTQVGSLLTPLPPRIEQHRIVAKVEDLMTLCDRLKSGLQTAQITQLHLADTLAEEAVK